MPDIIKRQHWLVKVLLLVVLLWVILQLPLLFSNIESAGAATDPQTQLDNTKVVETSGLSLALPDLVITAGSIPSGCHGRVWRRQSVVVIGTSVAVGWRQTAIDRWCGNTSGVIYDWGAARGDDGKWAASPYCWYDSTFGKVWWTVSRSEAKVWNQGTLKVCGKVSLGKTVNPRIYFHAATTTRPYLYWNYGDGVIRH
jgi:hypothetical protein